MRDPIENYMKVNCMKKNPVFIWSLVSVVIVIVDVLVYYFAFTNVSVNPELSVDAVWFRHYSTLVITVCAAIAVLSVGFTLKAFGLKSSTGKVWFCLLLGFAFWFVGEIIWWYFYAVDNSDPFPSIADVFWVLGYPLLILGTLLQSRMAKIKIPLREKIVVLVVTLIIGVIGVIFIIYPIAVEPITEDFTADAQFYSLIFPILDLFLIPSALLLVFKYRGGDFSRAWLIISIGLIITAIYDLLFSYTDWQCTLTFEDLFCNAYLILDPVYISFYLMIAVGATYFRQALKASA
ncbi:MAG: conserved membrane protein of unknown function [Promethearchaeota archaeon CR_4]|nr:MAG: conserved membrane protein of unknown function [Candidatus Lokiarchaeota archaeon CR_4]